MKHYIYVHICPDGKSYVGKTTNIKTRFGKNGCGYRKCSKFYDAILKFGWDNIEHIVLHETEDDCMARKLEKEEIYKRNSIIDGYNSNSKIDGWKNPYNKKEKIEIGVKQYSMSGELIREYNSIKEASKETGIFFDGIRKCCNGKRKSAGNFIWKKINSAR